MQLDLPSFVAKFEVSKVPFIAQVANSIQTIYLKRGDTKEKRAEMIQTIMDRQILAEKGNFPPLVIFPEGATTNGTSMLQFKKGSFASLRMVSPVVIRYKTSTNIMATQDVAGFLNHLLITMACGYITITADYLPNFEPNDYFWKHHWQEGKEEKWEAFARVTR